jgi:hypothetical protein
MMATDPFDPSIPRAAERMQASQHISAGASSARMAPAALILPTFFGPMALGAPEDARVEALSR